MVIVVSEQNLGAAGTENVRGLRTKKYNKMDWNISDYTRVGVAVVLLYH